MNNKEYLTPFLGDDGDNSTGLAKFFHNIQTKVEGIVPYVFIFLGIIVVCIFGYNLFRLTTKEGRQEMGKVIRDIIISFIVGAALILGYGWFHKITENEGNQDLGSLSQG